LALLMVQDPAQFDVIVTNNLFGDIITDLGAALQGGLGLAASGNLHPGRTSMFEPVHGSAPPLAGKNVANPMGAILSVALMLDYLGLKPDAAAIESAVHEAVVTGNGTREIGGALGTRETGDFISAHVQRNVQVSPRPCARHARRASDAAAAHRAVAPRPVARSRDRVHRQRARHRGDCGDDVMAIKTVGVLGCGLMGSGIAQVSAAAGY